MPKNQVGVKKNYQKQYEQLQREMHGVKSWVKKEYYREFYKRIAKTADQRLVELERLVGKKKYKEVKEWAYANAMRDIRGMFGEEATRFNRTLDKDINLNTLYKDINKVLRFLNAPTSSVSGITEIFDKRAGTLNAKYGTNLDWSTTGQLFESKIWKKTGAKKGSHTALKSIGEMQANKKKIKKALREEKPIIMIIAGDTEAIEKAKKAGKEYFITQNKDKKVLEQVNNYLRYYKKDVSSILDKI